LFVTLLQKDLKVKYKNTYLGYLWSLVLPLAQAAVFAVVFKHVLRVQVENYLVFLLCGLFVWQWMSNTVTNAPYVFLSNAAIIKKIPFPRSVLVASSVGMEISHFIMTLPLLMAVLWWHGLSFSALWLVGIPLQMIAQIMLVYGLSLAIATGSLFFRDLERLIGIFLMLVFYATPVIYPLDLFPQEFRWLFYLNPAAVLVEGWRLLIMKGAFDPVLSGLGLFYGACTVLVGMVIYRKLR
jgi:lipopolysaccharide transport system permease protein